MPLKILQPRFIIFKRYTNYIKKTNPNSITLKVCIQQPWSLLSITVKTYQSWSKIYSSCSIYLQKDTCVSIVHIYYHNYREVKSIKRCQNNCMHRGWSPSNTKPYWQKCIPKIQSKILSNLLLQLHITKQQKCIKCM